MKLLEGAAGVQSNVGELLALYKNIMNAALEQSRDGPLNKIPTGRQKPRGSTSLHISPRQHRAVSIIGSHGARHQYGYCCLACSMANNDAAVWLGQFLLEAVLDIPEKNDYIFVARGSAKTFFELWPRMTK